MNGDIKSGDVVQLKSGGPLMTVSSIDTYDGQPSALCVWFKEGKQDSAVFVLAMLTKK